MPAVVVTSGSFLCDHYVAVLRIDSAGVVLGDPATGLRQTDLATFARDWHGSAIIFERRAPVALASSVPSGLTPAPAPAGPSRP